MSHVAPPNPSAEKQLGMLPSHIALVLARSLFKLIQLSKESGWIA
jgi:hypothetical protein